MLLSPNNATPQNRKKKHLTGCHYCVLVESGFDNHIEHHSSLV